MELAGGTVVDDSLADTTTPLLKGSGETVSNANTVPLVVTTAADGDDTLGGGEGDALLRDPDPRDPADPSTHVTEGTGDEPGTVRRRSRLPSESAVSISAGSVYYYDDDYVEFEPPPDYVPRPPDGGWGWMVVLASFFCNMVVDGICYTVGVLYLDLEKSFPEVPISKMAWIGSLLSGMYLCVGPIVSSLTNRFGCRPVTMAGGFIASFCFLIAMFSPSINMLILTYGVFGGIGFGLIYLPAIVSVGYYFEKKRAFATGIAVCGSGVGTFVFGPLTKYLLDIYGWRGSLAIFSGIILNTVVMGALMRPLPLPKPPKVKPLLERIKEDKDARMRARSDPRLYRISEDPVIEESDYFTEPVPDSTDERDDRLLPTLEEGVISSTPSPNQPLANGPSFSVRVSGTDSPHLYVSTTNLERGDGGVGSGNLSRSRSRLRIPMSALMAVRNTGANNISAATRSTTRIAHRPSTASTVTEGGPTNRSGRPLYGSLLRVRHSTNASRISLPGLGGTNPNLSVTRRRKTTLTAPPTLPPSVFPAKKLSSPSPPSSLSSASPTRPHYDNSDARSTDINLPKNTDSDVTGERDHLAPLSTIKSTDGGDVADPPTIDKTAEDDTDQNPYDEYDEAYDSDDREDGYGDEEEGEDDGDVLQLSGPLPDMEEFARPLYKKDIFYAGSVTNLPEYRSQPDARSYYASVTSIPVHVSSAGAIGPGGGYGLGYESGGEEGGFRRRYLFHDLFRKLCPCLGKRASDTLTEMTNFSLFRNPVFLLVCLSNVFAFAGFYVPFVYIVGLAQQFGIEESRTSLFISIIGAANIVGRLAFGYLTDLPFVDSLLVNNVCMVIAGICTILCPFCSSFASLSVNLVVFGLSVAAFISLTSIILVDLIGLDSLTNAFGLLILFRGITSIIGPPLAGWIRDTTGNYNGSFYVSGSFIVVAGIISFMLRPMQRRCDARSERYFAKLQATGPTDEKVVGGAANGGINHGASFKRSTMSISASSQILRTGSNTFAIRPSYVGVGPAPRRRQASQSINRPYKFSAPGRAYAIKGGGAGGNKMSASEFNLSTSRPTQQQQQRNVVASDWSNGEAFALRSTPPNHKNDADEDDGALKIDINPVGRNDENGVENKNPHAPAIV